MSIQIVGFIAAFLVVFALYLEFSMSSSVGKKEREDTRFQQEGRLRRAEAANYEAWEANKRMHW
jgi:hypothetical protein